LALASRFCSYPTTDRGGPTADPCPVQASPSEQKVVPKISYFYGITITMYWNEPHHSRPHFHARYGEYKASLDLAGQIIVGFLPQRALRHVQDWAELHTDELHTDWQRIVNKEPPTTIAPLP